MALTRQSQATPLRSLCNEVHVWHIVLSQYLCQVDRLLSILDASEQRRAVRLNGWACRTRFIIAHAAVRIILGRYLEVDPHCLQFAFTSYGKPYLGAPMGDQRLEFSLSHCEHIALLAISRDRRVGIDVEQLRELNVQDMAIDVVCSKTESEPLRQLAPGLQSRAFYHLWTRKEAVTKALGFGLALPFERLTVTFLPKEPIRLVSVLDAPRERLRWALKSLRVTTGYTGYVAALAVEGHDWVLSQRVFEVDCAIA